MMTMAEDLSAKFRQVDDVDVAGNGNGPFS